MIMVSFRLHPIKQILRNLRQQSI